MDVSNKNVMFNVFLPRIRDVTPGAVAVNHPMISITPLRRGFRSLLSGGCRSGLTKLSCPVLGQVWGCSLHLCILGE